MVLAEDDHVRPCSRHLPRQSVDVAEGAGDLESAFRAQGVEDDLLEHAGQGGEHDSRGLQRPSTCHSIVGVSGPWRNGTLDSTSAQAGYRIAASRAGAEDLVHGSSPCSPRDGGGFRSPMNAELAEDVMDVVLDGRQLDAEVPRDLLVREPLVYQLEDLALSCCERLDRIYLSPAPRERGEPSHERRHDGGGAERLSA